jgi:Ca-activated chloride channel homolog
MLGFRFTQYVPEPEQAANFQNLLKIFLELLVYTNGNAAEALAWMNDLDKKYDLTTDEYGMGNFIEDLKEQGFLKEETPNGTIPISAKTERAIRQHSLDQIFGQLKKRKSGNHSSSKNGRGEDLTADRRQYEFGDLPEHILMTESIRNAQVNHGVGEFQMSEEDLEIAETDFKTLTSTVLMIDVSHSMVLYGEDRITPAKNVAMALAELVFRQYPKDRLDIIAFGNDAWPISVKDLPYLQVGPYHTNTVAGLQLAMDILRRRKTHNKQIFMITDGKPTCLHEYGGGYYKNSFGLDKRIVNRTLELAAQCRQLSIPVTTFMIANDPYLQSFVKKFTAVNHGRAFYSSLDGLGNYIFEDYIANRRRNVR